MSVSYVWYCSTDGIGEDETSYVPTSMYALMKSIKLTDMLRKIENTIPMAFSKYGV